VGSINLFEVDFSSKQLEIFSGEEIDIHSFFMKREVEHELLR